MINIFLDDWRPAPQHFTLVNSVKDCIKLFREQDVYTLSLDYNLGLNRPKGFDMAKWMVENNSYPKRIFLHSANPFGRIKMYHFLKRYKPDHVELYFYPAFLSRQSTVIKEN